MIMKPRRFALGTMALGVGCACFVACGGDDTTEPVADGGADATAVDGSTDSSTGVDTGTDAVSDTGSDSGTVDRGPTTIAFAGDPNGLFWDYGVGAALYIADGANNKIVKWTDKSGYGKTWDLPDPGDGGPTLGQVIRLFDGTMYVTNFGYGTAGTVFVVDPSGDAGSLGNLAVNRRRIGLAILADGTLVDAYFKKVDGGVQGALAKLSLTPDGGGKETDLALGLSKPIGVVYNERKIYVSDQNFGVLQSGLTGGTYPPDAAPIDPDAGDAGDGGDAGDAGDAAVADAGPIITLFSNVASPNLIAQGPDGTLFTGNSSGTVFQIDRAGVATSIITGLLGVRGVAYDGAHKRLFVAEHDPAGTANAIRIYPIN